MSAKFSLTPQQLDAFERDGVIRVPRFYSRDIIDTMADRVWEDLEQRFAMRRDQPQTWVGASPGKFQGLRKIRAFAPMHSPELHALADVLLGEGGWESVLGAGLLLTLPTPRPPLARPPWHLDIGGTERLDPLPILRIFTFLEAAPPGGGGTLYVERSHRLAIEIERANGGPVRSAQVRDRLKARHPWFAHLLTAGYEHLRGMMEVPAQVGGHPVRLREMTGAAGDLIIMHPAIMHGGAHNGSDRPRMMLTEWITRRTPAPA